MRSHLFFLFVIFFHTSLGAKVIVLFHNGSPVFGYDELIKQIKTNDQVYFSSGKFFKIKGILGNGSANIIFETDAGQALRIPLRAGVYSGERSYADLLDSYIRAQADLALRAVAVPEVFESIHGEYVLTEKIDVKFTFKQFLEHARKVNPNINTQVNQFSTIELWEKFIDFGESIWEYGTIGDFAPEQLVWDGKKWILLDFTDNKILAKMDGVVGPITFWSGIIPPAVKNEIKQRIIARRKACSAAKLVREQELELDALKITP